MEEAKAFITAWVDAWHRRDLQALLHHYTPNIVFQSPRVAARHKAMGIGSPDGRLNGRDALGTYFQEALDNLKIIELTVHDVMLGVGSFAVLYSREMGAKVVEVFTWDEEQKGKVKAVQVYYDFVC
eukprot:GHRR01009621.1.p1 GENE.GHRR01009621.1~~GHRR01009621.1.p1  ORF type:complete len:126 (+),score=32.26 GHRR01009621.1:402-779(+)